MRRISIFTDVAADRVRSGFMEEALFHQGVQVSLDHLGWREAQQADPTFISTWARDNSDLAETALARAHITVAFLDAQPLDWSPYTRAAEPVPSCHWPASLLGAVLMGCGDHRRGRQPDENRPTSPGVPAGLASCGTTDERRLPCSQ